MLILRTGSARGVRAYMGEPQRAASKPAFRMVLFTAAIHIIPGVIVVALLAVVGVKHHLTLSEVAQHLGADGQLLLFTLLILGGAIYALVRPSGMLGWARSAHPEIPLDDPGALMVVRLIGAVGCFIGLILLFSLVS